MNSQFITQTEGVGFAIGGGSSDISQGKSLGVGCGDCGECEGCEHCGRTSCKNGGGSSC